MMQIQNLKLIHDRDFRTLIDGLTFAVNPSDKIVIIGEEGEGKSTLLKWIYDPSLIEDYAEGEGVRSLHGEKLGYLPQELSDDAKPESIYEFMCHEHLFLELTPPEVKEIARSLGVDSEFLYSDQKMETLSGGEKVKVQLARILASKPTVLLLDEPSNDIDIDTLEWLEKFIRESKLGIVFVSHDETLIEGTANRVIHIEQLNHKTIPRHTVANIGYRDYVSQRLHGFELQDSRAKSERREQRIAEEKWRRIYQRVEHEQNTISRGDPATGRLLKKKMHAVKSMGRRLEKQRENMTDFSQAEREINLKFDYEPDVVRGKVILNLNVDKLYAGSVVETSDVADVDKHAAGEAADIDKHAAAGEVTDATDCVRAGTGVLLAENIHLEVRAQDKICITGKNGAGKTTLMKIIKEELGKRRDVKLAYMPQNYEELLDPKKTPLEFLEKDGSKEERIMINNRLASLRFTPDDMGRSIENLSGGQKAKLILLSLTISGAELLLLDEPTRNFSPLSGPVIRNMLAGFPGAIISISHDRKYINEVADKVYELDKGGLHEISEV